MRNSLTLGTRGKLSKRVKRSLVIASFGFIAIANVSEGGGYENASYREHQNKTDKLKERKLAVIKDEEDLVLIIKIFTQCL